LPHRLVARNSKGETLSITALIKTQGSDTKLVAQMQPFYEAKTLARQNLGKVSVPPLVTQIGDGENGGVMMNEFPGAFYRAWHEMAQQGGGTSRVVGLTGTEYLELIEAAGCKPEDYSPCQPVGQHRIWERILSGRVEPRAVAKAIEEVKHQDANFRLDGASWTNDRSWVNGYEGVLNPMNQLSALFHEKVDPLLKAESEGRLAVPGTPRSGGSITRQHRYRNALLHNLLLQSSDFRYWGQGRWTDYAREIYRRGEAILRAEF
jgi:hypothetical protein